MKSKAIKSIFTVAGLFSATILLNSCGHSEAKKEEKSTAATVHSVEVFSLEKGMMSTKIQIPGELIAKHSVDIYAKVNSFVQKMNVDVGSEVKEGQLLVTMEAPELSSQLSASASRLQSQEAMYSASKALYDRLLQTSKTAGTISPNELDQALARKNADLAQLEAAKSSYKEIADNKNYLAIRAPFSGFITARNISVGAYVGPSGKGSEFPMFTLQDQRKLRLIVLIPEAYTSYLGEKNEITFTVKAFPSEVFKAKINRLAGALDTKFRSERIEMDIDNSQKKLLPGMVAEVKITFPATEKTFVVPKAAVANAPEKVFVVKIVNGKAEWVEVRKGREADGKVEIYGDLSEGDQLVKVATEEVREGSEVKIKKD